MKPSTIPLLNSFTIDSLPNLDVVTLGALELFQLQKLPHVDFSMYTRPLVVGSGNAEATGRIIFETKDAIFASESNYEEKLRTIPSIDGVVLFSASGGKHAPIIAKCAKEFGKHITLITDQPNSEARAYLTGGDREFVLFKNREPYTYNTSTYMGMILASTQEDPAQIERFITQQIDVLDFTKLAQYDKYYIIVPARFSGVVRMLQIKFIELFGRTISYTVETSEYVKHATTVVPSKELFISFGEENTLWGNPEARLYVPLPDNANYGAMMAIGYYVMGKLQASHPDYFKQHIKEYTEAISKVFGETFSPIVE